MKAAVRERYGAPAVVVEVREIERPVPADGEVLVRVRASSLNLSDWYDVTGRPWVARGTRALRRPRESRVGTDYAGTVEAVGRDVTEFRPGDEVFGGQTGALEIACGGRWGAWRGCDWAPCGGAGRSSSSSRSSPRRTCSSCASFSRPELTSAIDRRFELSEVVDAFSYVGDGHPGGKVVFTVP